MTNIYPLVLFRLNKLYSKTTIYTALCHFGLASSCCKSYESDQSRILNMLLSRIRLPFSCSIPSYFIVSHHFIAVEVQCDVVSLLMQGTRDQPSVQTFSPGN